MLVFGFCLLQRRFMAPLFLLVLLSLFRLPLLTFALPLFEFFFKQQLSHRAATLSRLLRSQRIGACHHHGSLPVSQQLLEFQLDSNIDPLFSSAVLHASKKYFTLGGLMKQSVARVCKIYHSSCFFSMSPGH
jgi:hypothetical protein